MILHGNHLEDLRDLLAQFLRSQPLPPLGAEVILVQSNGMKHWLELSLAADDALGICAATRLELPSAYLWQVYRSVLGADAVPPHMPFDKNSLLWRLVRLLPLLTASNPVYAPLRRYLGDQSDGRKLYQLSLQVADVLDGYQSYRADWLSDWAQGEDVLRSHDGSPLTLEATHSWQAQLWRDIRDDVGEALADASRASVHARFMSSLKALAEHSRTNGKRPVCLPPRIVVFGISSLPMQTVEALAALGRVCQVLMVVQNPCQHYWGDIVEGHDCLRQQLRRRQQAKPVQATAPGTGTGVGLLHSATHPLLASWGKQGRDYLHLLDDFDSVETYKDRFLRVNVFIDPVEGLEHPSQLAQLQSAILNLEPLPEIPEPLPADDASITLVTTHSAQREVEVLHDRLLSWFDAESDLVPRDVIVMVPDMEAFAPYIQAVFGRFSSGQARHIPYSVADSTPRQSPLVQALDQLLALPQARVSLADWLSLFEVSAVRKRFGLTESDVEVIQNWLSLAGVRWGMDAQHRRAWGVPEGVSGLDQNTWAFGLRRLLLGYAVGPGMPWGDTLPQAAIGGLDAPLISRLLSWIDATSLTLVELSETKTPAQWGQTLVDLVERFFDASDEGEERLIQRLVEPLEAWQLACEEAQLETPLPLEVVRDHWLSQIQESGLHQRFFGGGVQFGTLMPMRAIPFKIVCLLGMNDGDYPRQASARDFDLMAQSWRPGDRSRREDDRYLFLEAILSARQKLYISWQGHRATDNAELPPSVLVAQLMDYLKAGWLPARAPEQQPLQPFSESYFLQDSEFSTYDRDWARVHAMGEKVPAPSADLGAVSPEPMAAVAPGVLTLTDLRQLLRQPVEVFFRGRMRVRLDSVEELQQDEEPFSLNGLEKYQAGQDLLNAPDPGQALKNYRMTGKLPMAAFGARQANELADDLTVVLERLAPWKLQYPDAVPAQSIDLSLAGVSIKGTLTGLWSRSLGADPSAQWLQREQRLGAVLEGKDNEQTARAHIVVGLWLNHLAACASGMPLVSTVLGLDGQVGFKTLPIDAARDILRRLVQAYLAAWERPLPVACKTAWAYLQAQSKADKLALETPDKAPPNPHDAAQQVFEGSFNFSGELVESAYLARAFDGYSDLEAELPHWAEVLYGDMARHVSLGIDEGASA